MTEAAAESIIARVVAVEKQYAKEVERAEAENGMRVEAHKKRLEQKKAAHEKKVRESNKQQLDAAIEKAGREAAEKLRLLEDEWAKLHDDTALLAAARRTIAEIILKE